MRVDEKPLSLSISRLPNARRSWCGSVRPPYLLGVPDGAGLFYSWPIGCRLSTLPPRSGSAGALSTSGCGGFSRRVSRDWQTNQVAAIGVCRSRLPYGSSKTWAHDAPAQTRWSPVDGDKFRKSFHAFVAVRWQYSDEKRGLAIQLSQGQGRQPHAGKVGACRRANYYTFV